MDGDLFPAELSTERLDLEPLGRESIDPLAYYEILSGDPGIEEVARYTPWEPHETPKESLEFLRSVEQGRSEGENAEWVVRPAADRSEGDWGQDDDVADLAGVVGLSPEWDRRVGDLGVWLRRRYWGNGYAGEALARLLPVAFERLDLDLVVARVRPENERSRRAFDRFVDRFGGQLDGTMRNDWLDLDGTVHDTCRYSISHEEWAANR